MKTLCIAAVTFLVCVAGCQKQERQQQHPVTQTSWSGTDSSAAQDHVAKVRTTNGAWSIDGPVSQIPDEELAGEVWGKKLDGVTCKVSSAALTISTESKPGSLADREIMIFVGSDDLVTGKEIVVTPKTVGHSAPHIHMLFSKEGEKWQRGTLMYVGEYSMRLKVLESTKDKVVGKVHLSLPDYKLTHIIGRFEATRK